MKNTVVIGGAGFIGLHVVQMLCDAGRPVTVLGRRPLPLEQLPSGCSYISGDYGNRSVLREVLSPGGEVIDLAYSTVPKTSFGDPVFDVLSNLPASVGLLEEASAVGVGKVVIVSSGGTVYGPAKYLPIDEEHPTGPISPYGITKLTIDRYAMMFHHTRGLPVSIVRPANAYGARQKSNTGQGFIAAAIDAILNEKTIDVYGESGAVRDYIHVEDVASSIVAALELGKSGHIYNAGTGVGSSNAAIIELLKPHAAQLSKPIAVRYQPRRSFDVQSNILNSAKLHDDTGWTCKIDLESGISAMWHSAVSGL